VSLVLRELENPQGGFIDLPGERNVKYQPSGGGQSRRVMWYQTKSGPGKLISWGGKTPQERVAYEKKKTNWCRHQAKEKK